METSNPGANYAVLHAQNDRWCLGPLEIFLFVSKSRCFACKTHRWGLGPIETSNSCAKDAVFHAHNDRFCLGLLETCYCCPKVAVLHAKNTHEGWDPWRLVILMLSTLFSCKKRQVMPGTHRDLLIRSKSRCFASKIQTWGLGSIKISNSDANHAVLHAKSQVRSGTHRHKQLWS